MGFVPFQLRNVTAFHPIFTYHPRIPGTSVAEDYNGSSDPVGFLWENSDKNLALFSGRTEDLLLTGKDLQVRMDEADCFLSILNSANTSKYGNDKLDR